jgi:hypothetical protein
LNKKYWIDRIKQYDKTNIIKKDCPKRRNMPPHIELIVGIGDEEMRFPVPGTVHATGEFGSEGGEKATDVCLQVAGYALDLNLPLGAEEVPDDLGPACF